MFTDEQLVIAKMLNKLILMEWSWKGIYNINGVPHDIEFTCYKYNFTNTYEVNLYYKEYKDLNNPTSIGYNISFYDLVFNPKYNVMKTLFGEESEGLHVYTEYLDEPNETREVLPPKKGWQYHLQQMVLEENPLNYLEKVI